MSGVQRFRKLFLPTSSTPLIRSLSRPARTLADPIDYFDHDEFQASLDAPDPVTSPGVRDRAMLHLAHAAGLKVSELIGSCAVFSDS